MVRMSYNWIWNCENNGIGVIIVTKRDFEQLRTEKSEAQFQAWFDDRADMAVRIGGVLLPCIKLNGKRVALRDGTLYPVEDVGKIEKLEPRKASDMKEKLRFLQVYDDLDVLDQISVKRYFDLLEEKANLEKEMRRQKEYPEGTLFCSFCGKSEKEAKRMIAGPFKVQICDECVQLCGEILAEPYKGEE